MAERAHPEDPGFKDKWFCLKKNIYKKRLYERYRLCNKIIKNKIVLDIPCGVGWGTSLLTGYKMIIGIDCANEAIQYAKDHYENKTRKFIVGNMASIDLEDNSVEVILCLEGFEHVSREVGNQFINECKRVLKLNGILVLTCPVLNERGETTGNPYHLCEYPEEELIQILNENFSIIDLKRFEGPDIPEYRAVLKNFKGQRYQK